MDLMNQSTLGLGLIYATTKISVVEEIFIFPLQSFLAEMGGSLGMLLGFSLSTLFDGFSSMIEFYIDK